MRSKRTVSLLLAACLLLSLIPAAVLSARAANPNPVYQRAAGPEVALFNSITGNNQDFYKSMQSSSRYNAVAANFFGDLKYDTKVTGLHTYKWGSFASSNINAMRQKNSDIQIGYSVTRTSKYHKHTSGLYYWKMTSYSDTTLGFNTGGIAGAGLINYTGYSSSQDTIRQGNCKFHTWLPQTAGIDLVFNANIIKYDDGDKVCSCGGTTEGCMVCFYDGTAPELEKISIQDQNGNYRTSFKPGDTVNIVLTCSEDIRFADDKADGKGDIYIGFRINGTSDSIYAHLTSLEGNKLTFSYKVDENDHSIYDIAWIDLKDSPNGQPLMSDSAKFDLWMVQGSQRFQVTKPSNADANGFTKTTSCVTDLAGNPLYLWGADPSRITRTFYIDGEAPYVAAVEAGAETNNADVKAALNKTEMSPSDKNYNDESDTYLGVGDRLILKAYLNEIATGGTVYLTTNIKNPDGTYLQFSGYAGYHSVSAVEANLGSQYGLGASQGNVSLVNCGSATIVDGMTIDDAEGKIRVTSVRYYNVADKSGNAANDTVTKVLTPKQQYHLDTIAPTATAPAVNQANRTDDGFFATFKIQDNVGGSGVVGLPASVTLGGGSLSGKFQYAVIATPEPDDKTVWLDGTEGTPAPFVQTGDNQYLLVKAIDGEAYDVSKLIFTLSDYAGNRAATTEVSVVGVGFDSVGPFVRAGNTSRVYDNAGFGTMTATINASDPSGVTAVQYQWNDGTELTAESAGWVDAVGMLGDTGVAMTASVTVDSGDAFKQTLWVKATDEPGNVSVTSLGQYSYSLAGIHYDLEYSTAVITDPALRVASKDSNGVLIFDVQKKGDENHYIQIVDQYYLSRSNIFSTYDWYVADFDDSDGYKFTNLRDRDNRRFKQYSDRNYTGDLTVTVYSGVVGETDGEGNKEGDIFRSGLTEDADVIMTTNTKTETFPLHISYMNNDNSDVFSNSNLGFDTSTILDYYGYRGWEYREDSTYYGRQCTVSSLEGLQVFLDLGEDINGWNFSDIDWENSFIALDGYEEANKISGLGYGPVQTITLPDSALYTTGNHHLNVVIERHSKYYDGDHPWSMPYYNGTNIYIDTTEPGSLQLDMLAKGDYEETQFEALSFDATETVYLPTQQGNAFLSVSVLNPDGTPHEVYMDVNQAIGVASVVAWKVSDPSQKVILQREYLTENGGTISISKDNADYNCKRLLRFTTDFYAQSQYSHDEHYTDVEKGIIGLDADVDTVIALQVRYGNGASSEITYLTVHPIDIGVNGKVTTTLELDEQGHNLLDNENLQFSGVGTVDPGKATVVFTPDAGSNMTGLTLYCQEATLNWSVPGQPVHWANSIYDFVPGSEPIEMTLQSDGTYTAQIPTKTETNLTEQLQTQARGCYGVWAVDPYGNRADLNINMVGIIADGAAPVVTEKSLSVEDGAFTATYKIYDDSLYSWFHTTNTYTSNSSDPFRIPQSRPMQLTLSYNEDYAAAIGASDTLRMTVDGDSFTWTNDGPNPMGIYEVSAEITREGSFLLDDSWYAQYLKSPTDTYMTVTVKGVIGPNADNTDMTLNLSAVDAHGNLMEPVGVSQTVTGVQPAVTEAVYQRVEPDSDYNFDRALYLTFNTPVQPEESWINRSIEGYDTQWHDAFPIWKDGDWTISFTDLFGTRYDLPITLTDVIGEYGFELSFSTLDYVAASEGVAVNYEADSDNEAVTYGGIYGSYTFNDNGTYYLTRDCGGESDSLPIHLNNIVSGGPEETLFFYLDEFKEQYVAGSAEQFRGTTTAPVTVSYRTSRETSPDGVTIMTFKNGDSDAFAFRYYDAATDFTYTITGKLSDYGITLDAPPVPYQDTDPPLIDLVTVWKQRAGGYVQADAFPGSADDAAVLAAIEATGTAQGYDFVVNASDYSKWKVVVKSAEPSSMSFATAASDPIAGVSVSGNNVLVTKDVAADFWIVVVDNATADSAATTDNFSSVKIPFGSYCFDTVAPTIETMTVASGLYSKAVYIKIGDQDDRGNDTSAGVTVSGVGVLENTDPTYAEYPYKLIFTENDAIVLITATDAAGNSTTTNIKVTGIDTSAPTLSTTWSPCYQDPTTGKLDQSNPTTGPVNTDVVAHITSNKPIANVTATITTSTGSQYEYDFSNPDGEYWGSISYTSQRVTVRFIGYLYDEDISIDLTVYAPNGKGTVTHLTMHDDVIDKEPTRFYLDDFEMQFREGYDVPYAATYSLRPMDGKRVLCTNYGPTGVWYYDSWPDWKYLNVTVTDASPQTFVFTDLAGNITTITYPDNDPNNMGGNPYLWGAPDASWLEEIDGIAPKLTVELSDDASAANGTVTATVTVNEECTLSADSSDITCGHLTQTTDSEGKTVWTGTVDANANGTFRLTATDLAGNATTAIFTVHNVDRTLPVIAFTSSTVKLRQDSTDAELAALLLEGVRTWDNVELKADSLTVDTSEVHLELAGVYPVTYSVEDTVGNVGRAVRYVKVIDKNQPIVTVDDVLTEQNGVTSIKVGDHVLSVGGLKTPNEPYTVQLVKGIWSAGQLKRAPDGIPVGDNGVFTIDTAGFYTLYLTTQSRQTYRILLYVED